MFPSFIVSRKKAMHEAVSCHRARVFEVLSRLKQRMHTNIDHIGAFQGGVCQVSKLAKYLTGVDAYHNI